MRRARFVRLRALQQHYNLFRRGYRGLSPYKIYGMPGDCTLGMALDFVVKDLGFSGTPIGFYAGWGHWQDLGRELDMSRRSVDELTRKGKKYSLVIWRDIPITIKIESESCRWHRRSQGGPYLESVGGDWVSEDLEDYISSPLEFGCAWPPVPAL